MNTFKNLSNRNKALMVVCIVSLIFFLFYVDKDAGGITYYGNYYEAGSLMSPNEYTDYGYGNLYNGDAGELNRQLWNLRIKNLIYVIGFGIGAVVSLWLLLREEEVKDLLLEIRSLSTAKTIENEGITNDSEIDNDKTEELMS